MFWFSPASSLLTKEEAGAGDEGGDGGMIWNKRELFESGIKSNDFIQLLHQFVRGLSNRQWFRLSISI